MGGVSGAGHGLCLDLVSGYMGLVHFVSVYNICILHINKVLKTDAFLILRGTVRDRLKKYTQATQFLKSWVSPCPRPCTCRARQAELDPGCHLQTLPMGPEIYSYGNGSLDSAGRNHGTMLPKGIRDSQVSTLGRAGRSDGQAAADLLPPSSTSALGLGLWKCLIFGSHQGLGVHTGPVWELWRGCPITRSTHIVSFYVKRKPPSSFHSRLYLSPYFKDLLLVKSDKKCLKSD